MASKGIDFYGYVSDSRFSIWLQSQGSNDAAIHTTGFPQTHHFEIDRAGLPPTEVTGCFRMRAMVDGNEVWHRWAVINPVTGDIPSGNMGKWIDGQPSFISSLLFPGVPGNFQISYGFACCMDLQSSHQAYMYITEDQADWMARLNPPENATLHHFVLPGAHDCGAFEPVFSPVENAFANTQKDSILTQLLLGARFFDIRPGYYPNDDYEKGDDGKYILINGENVRPLRHIHTTTPGVLFKQFLQETCNFLESHPGEIVVAYITDSGFYNDNVRRPVGNHVERTIYDVLSKSTIKLCGIDQMQCNYRDLVNENMRLIIIIHHTPDNPPVVVSSWDEEPYKTEDPKAIVPMLANFLLMRKDYPAPKVLQLCSTYQVTNRGSSIAWTIPAGEDYGGPLLYAKPQFDLFNYAWLINVDNTEFFGSQLAVMLNDFIDNALADICAKLTQRRFDALSK